MSDFTPELEAAERIALEAAELVRGYHGRPLSVDNKPGDEPVTEADHAANTLIVSRLRAAFPDDVILSEEIPDDGSRLGRSRVWWSTPSTARATSSWATPGSW
jgi:3'-phosphoadenosine 5'-phosphosulfate (PAPS) 3'-phosphatase